MKRFTVLVLMLAGVLTAVPMLAQSKDLAGSWALDVEKSGSNDGPPVVVITQTEREFTARLGSATARLMTFKLDGTESVVSDGFKGKAEWKGSKLDATIVTPGGPETITLSREGTWMVIEVKSEKGPLKLYFKKTPAGL